VSFFEAVVLCALCFIEKLVHVYICWIMRPLVLYLLCFVFEPTISFSAYSLECVAARGLFVYLFIEFTIYL
jgi:hypothetical protein